MNMSLSKLWEVLKGREAWGAVVHRVTESGHNLAREQQQVPGACSNSGRKEAEEHAWDISGLQQFGKAKSFISQIGKGIRQGCILSPSLFNVYASTSCELPEEMKNKLDSRLPGETSITSDMQMIPPLWQKLKRNQRASWWKWKSWLKTQHSKNEYQGIWSHHFMANR